MMTPTDHPQPDPVEMFIHDYMLFLDGEGPRPQLSALDPDTRAEVAARLRILRAARTTAAPAPDGARERIALRFGFARAGLPIPISGSKLKSARRRAGLELKQISAALAAAGTPMRTSDLLHVETADTTPIDQPVVTTLVAILGTSVMSLEADFSAEMADMRVMLASPRFEQIIAEWAGEHARDVSEIRQVVHRQALAAKFRAEGISEEQLADIVQAILRSLER
jgi:hypothetical protein